MMATIRFETSKQIDKRKGPLDLTPQNEPKVGVMRSFHFNSTVIGYCRKLMNTYNNCHDIICGLLDKNYHFPRQITKRS